MLPGFANAHSHAFHRALRGRTHDADGGTFWTWREQMYAVAARLDPDSYLALARAAYAEMALAGVTSVGEFHYLHHAPGGAPYADPNAMGAGLRRRPPPRPGIRLTLLDTCYLAGGFGDGRRSTACSAGSATATPRRWAERVAALRRRAAGCAIGAAVHSVRAVPRERSWRRRRRRPPSGRPLHVHLSEQPAENAACLRRHGCTPTGLLADAGRARPARPPRCTPPT